MAENITGNINWYVCVPVKDKQYLSGIRHWQHLKIAFESDHIWIKDITQEEVDSVEIKGLPSKEIFYQQGNKLYCKGSLLPQRNAPALLWTPVERALPIELPVFNHNYFGIQQQIQIKMREVENEENVMCLITTKSTLEKYINEAPAARLQHLKWVLLSDDRIVILGNPILPINGEVLWQRGSFLIPAGYDFELSILSSAINEQINATNENWIIWDRSGNYFSINKNFFVPLTIGSFRLTTNN